MRRHSIIVPLPSGWHEVEGASPRAYRRAGKESGILQVSLKPSLDPPISHGEQALAHLNELVASLGLQLDTPIASGHEKCGAGVLAFALYRHIDHGLVQIWLIPAEVTIFASWQMGGLSTAEVECKEAHEILRKVRFEHSEDASFPLGTSDGG